MSLPRNGRQKRPTILHCDFSGCGKSFGRVYDLQRHQRIHCQYEERKFKCEVEGCDFRANQLAGLKVHSNSIHLGIRMPCDFAGCDKTFSDPSSRNKHKMRFHVRRPSEQPSDGEDSARCTDPITLHLPSSPRPVARLISQPGTLSQALFRSESVSTETTDDSSRESSEGPSRDFPPDLPMDLKSAEPVDPPSFQYPNDLSIPPVPSYFPMPKRSEKHSLSFLQRFITNDYYVPCTRRDPDCIR